MFRISFDESKQADEILPAILDWGTSTGLSFVSPQGMNSLRSLRLLRPNLMS